MVLTISCTKHSNSPLRDAIDSEYKFRIDHHLLNASPGGKMPEISGLIMRYIPVGTSLVVADKTLLAAGFKRDKWTEKILHKSVYGIENYHQCIFCFERTDIEVFLTVTPEARVSEIEAYIEITNP